MSVGNLTKLQVISGKQELRDIISSLRDLLKMAEEGKILAIAVATVEKDGGAGNLYMANNLFLPLAGSISLMQHEYLMDMMHNHPKKST